MPSIIVRSDGARLRHTSLDLPEELVIEAKRRRVSIAKIATRALREEFGMPENRVIA